MAIQTGTTGRYFQVELEDEDGIYINADDISGVVVYWVSPYGMEYRPDPVISGGVVEFLLDDIIQVPGTYYLQIAFTYEGVSTRTQEMEVEVEGQAWVPYRSPIIHYRIWKSPQSVTQWAGMSKQDLIDAGVRVYDIMYEIDMGRWKVFNGRAGYDDLDYVTETAGAVDHLLNIFGQVNIINMALGRLGQEPIKDLNENSPGAKWGHQFYRITVSEVMAAYDWSSAIVRQQMSLVPDELGPGVPNPERNHFTGYELQYYVPQAPKPIRVSHLFTYQFGAYQRADTDFRIEGDYLFTNLPHAGLVYVGDYTAQTGRLDPFIIELIVLRLASRLAFAITSSERMTQSLLGEYAAKMAEAQFADASRARESTNIDVFPDPQASWTREW